jgi:hypothetical protein
MSAKVSDVWRQNKGRTDSAPVKKEARDLVASSTRKSVQEDSDVERQLLEFDLTNKWGPCQGTFSVGFRKRSIRFLLLASGRANQTVQAEQLCPSCTRRYSSRGLQNVLPLGMPTKAQILQAFSAYTSQQRCRSLTAARNLCRPVPAGKVEPCREAGPLTPTVSQAPHRVSHRC